MQKILPSEFEITEGRVVSQEST